LILKFIEGGLPAEKIVVKPNFVYPDPGVGLGSGGYALYVGRLSEEKGVDTLLEAWEQLSVKIPLKIVGDGPLASQVAEFTKRLPQVEWLGRRGIAEVHALMGESKFLIFPSKWYETFGRVAVEAFAKGTPVIASKIGAMPLATA
jgi:glycosyltransferase involved in cell wall biosynthesis